MKFLVDAQLPQRLARWLRAEGHDVLHTLDFPNGNRTEDEDLNRLSVQEERTVVTKDGDFVDTFLIRKAPHRLLLVSTGNIGNAELLKLFEDNVEAIVSALEASAFVELSHNPIVA